MLKYKKNRLIVFAFKETTSSKVLERLKVRNKRYVDSSAHSIDSFVSGLPFREGLWVLGIGDYSGRDKEKLRIETRCHPRFRKRTLTGKSKMSPFLKPGLRSKYAQGLGNSFCNLISHRIINRTRAEYAFIHIPKGFEVESAVSEISAMISLAK